MCGFTGYWSASGGAEPGLAQRMGDVIAHRGPDDHGVWIDKRRELALAHRRLAIIDLSDAGRQPMLSACERYVLAYNGEIYNHRDLRQELEAAGAGNWGGHSDTETMLAAIAKWGVEGALSRFNGMFGFALWDRKDRVLTLARDRMGEKPVYYGASGGTFFFGSEIKSFRAHPDWSPRIDRNAITRFMRYSYVPGPDSIFEGIRKLPPAHYLSIHAAGDQVGEPVCYWDLGAAARAPALRGSPDTMADELERLLLDSVKLRMASDVPLGAFLSGGYDSSIVTALMQAQSSRPVRTFTIGFDEKEYNEADHAKAVAAHLGTDHTEMYVSPRDALEVIPELPQIWDEPFADSSQIPTLLLSRLTREHVTVSLSGDGGDELFCGYNRYLTGHAMWRRLNLLPVPARHALAAAMVRTPRGVLDMAERVLPAGLKVQNLADRLPKLAQVLGIASDREYYRRLVSHWDEPTGLVIGCDPDCDRDMVGWDDLPTILERMMMVDLRTYLPDDILVKVDRASMAVSLEGRIPLLDHRVVEFALRTPLDLKYRGGQGKWLLRQVLYRYVPERLMDRPKMGFGVPIDDWLRGPLRDWAEALLDETRLRNEGFFDPRKIRLKWEQHLSGRRRWHYYLWDVLMFQAWHEHNGQLTGNDAQASR